MAIRRALHVMGALFFTAVCLPDSIQTAPGAEFNIADSDEAGLIAAIHDANANGEADVINLAENGIYTLTTIEDTTDGQNGLPSITGEIVVNGNGSVIRRSAGIVPHLRIFHVAASGDLTLNDLTVRNGRALDSGDLARRSGGGILNYGTLKLVRCVVENNRSGDSGFSGTMFGNNGGRGGGIYNFQGTVIIDASAIRDNQTGSGESGNQFGGSGGDGAGIFNIGILILNALTLSNNTTGQRGTGTIGDGSGGNGGGLYNSTGSEATITACTITQNVAEGAGGGLLNYSQLLITGGTITENSAQDGGGVVNNADLDIRNTMIVEQSAGPDCLGVPPFSLGHNRDSDGSCALAADGDMTVPSAMLGPLQDNGGPTQTHAPLTGSPAIDAGDSAASATDQRGFRRAFDGDGDGTGAPDIGAVEYYDCDGNAMEDAADDADADTIPDGCDECPDADDLLDADGDGVCDSDDICAEGDDNVDTDSDSMPDACDDTPMGQCCGGGPPAMLPLVLLGWGFVRRRRSRAYPAYAEPIASHASE